MAYRNGINDVITLLQKENISAANNLYAVKILEELNLMAFEMITHPSEKIED